MCDVSFSVEKGYHEYKDNWVAVVGELSCRREPTVPIVKIDLRSASLTSRIASGGMMEDRGPFGSGNCLSCCFTTQLQA